jgi:hypothetical protein
MFRSTAAAVLASTLALLAGCAADKPASSEAGAPAPEPLVHEYRTGSMIAQKEKHVTTEEERQAARDAIDQIRSTTAGAPGRP